MYPFGKQVRSAPASIRIRSGYNYPVSAPVIRLDRLVDKYKLIRHRMDTRTR